MVGGADHRKKNKLSGFAILGSKKGSFICSMGPSFASFVIIIINSFALNL